MPTVTRRVPGLRRNLLAGVALALAATGAAQAIPVPGAAPPQVSPDGTAPVIASSGPSMTVDINALRTIIDWSSFNIAPGESVTFVQPFAGDIVLNRVPSGAMNINGALTSIVGSDPQHLGTFHGGGVFLYSPDGVVFGPNAVVDVNSFLATSSAFKDSEILDAKNFNFNMTGSGHGGPLIVRAGASLHTKFGELALVAPMVTTEAGAVVTGEEAQVFYGAADSYRIRFSGGDNNALNLLDFIVPAASDGTPAATALNLAGLTQGRDIAVVAISRAAVAGLLINAPGLITATRSSLGDFGGGVLITTGENLLEGTSFGTRPRTPGATAGSATFGQVTAERYLGIFLETDATLGNLTATGLRGGANVYAAANNVTIGANGVDAGHMPDAPQPANVNILLDASGVVNVTSMSAAGDAGALASTFATRAGTRPDITIGSIAAGGNVNLVGGPAARVTSITAGGFANISTRGLINIGAITANSIGIGGVTVTTGNLTSRTGINVGSNGTLTVGTLTGVGISATAAGDLAITAVNASGDATLGSTSNITVNSAKATGKLTLQSTGAIFAQTLSAGSMLIASNGAQTLGALTSPGDIFITSHGPETVDTVVAGTFEATADAPLTLKTLTTTGTLAIENRGIDLGTVTAGGDARLGVGDMPMVIRTSFTAPNLVLESFVGAFALGGAAGTGPSISNASLQKIKLTGGLSVYAGTFAFVLGPAGPLGDLTVLDTDIDPARIPELDLFAGPANSILVQGQLRPTAPGALLLIGDNKRPDTWMPKTIVINGSIGSASGDALAGFTNVHDFKIVDLNAGADILMGSKRFTDLVAQTPADQLDLDRDQPVGVAAQGDEVGRQFLVSGVAHLSAGSRILQQDSGLPGAGGGIYLTGQGAADTDPLLVLGKAQTADVFPALAAGNGGVVTGQQASFSSRIVRAPGDTGPSAIRINGCPLGVGCQISTPATEFRVDSFRPAAPRPAIDPPVLSPPPPVDEDARDIEAITAGGGNEEIWRRKK